MWRQRPRLGDPPFLPRRLSSAASPGGAGVTRRLRVPPRGPCCRRWGPALGRSRVSCTEAQGQRSALCGHAAPAIGGNGARRPRGPVLPVRVLSEAEGTVASRGWGTGHGSSLRARSDVPTACARRGASPLTPHSLGPTCSNGGDAGDPRSTVGAKSDERGVQPRLAGRRRPAWCLLGTGLGAGRRQRPRRGGSVSAGDTPPHSGTRLLFV